jgi:hypothetical protein
MEEPIQCSICLDTTGDLHHHKCCNYYSHSECIKKFNNATWRSIILCYICKQNYKNEKLIEIITLGVKYIYNGKSGALMQLVALGPEDIRM